MERWKDMLLEDKEGRLEELRAGIAAMNNIIRSLREIKREVVENNRDLNSIASELEKKYNITIINRNNVIEFRQNNRYYGLWVLHIEDDIQSSIDKEINVLTNGINNWAKVIIHYDMLIDKTVELYESMEAYDMTVPAIFKDLNNIEF